MTTARQFKRCEGVTRRDYLKVGGLTALGCGMVDLLRLRAAAAPNAPAPRARSCILIWLDGGPSHLDTFDPKPQAPAEVRGEFKSIPTSVPGVHVSELLPRTAEVMQHVAIIRSMTSPLGEHNFGTHYLMTGYKPTPALEYPAHGAVVAHSQSGAADLPPFIAVPNMRVGGANFKPEGYLPAATAPFEVGGDPSRPDFRVRDLDPFTGMTDVRIERRREYLQALEGFRARTEQANSGPSDPVFEQAYRLMTSDSARKAFDLSQESDKVRNRYGRKTIGQSCLLARRLVESGVPFVTVNNPGWDTHENAYTRLKEGYTGAVDPMGLVPSLDLAFSALVTDLAQRGRLDETLVVVMGEFGRTPKLNTAGGRDHWPRVFSVALAGAGIEGGQVVGESDAMGESPKDRPVTPSDLAATIFTLLGIDPKTTLHTPDGRPVHVAAEGEAIRELVG
jgi:hypothetical protein